MTSLSVVIITYNEEKNIARCMQSVMPIADEVVVLDSFSTDRTAVIVQQLGGILHRLRFQGYGAQKNAAAALATHDHILFLDADESLSEQLCDSILREKRKGFPQDGYLMNRLNNYLGQWIRHGSWYPDRKLRLANKKKSAWSLDIVHESLVPDGDASIGLLSGDLLHYTYVNYDDHVDKNNKYSRLSAQLLFEKGKKATWFKLVFNPFWAFFTSYFLRAGFLDGFNGFVIAVHIGHLTFLKYSKLYRLWASKQL
ncbi:MAG TPA: glycosyltransferase family 2 protein [Puia sp.]|nr:glycosyltransferase family 2 protein [Puia sp.]